MKRSSMRSTGLVFVGVLAAAAFLVPLADHADADVVRLRTGVNIKGVPKPEQSDENVLVIEDVLSGARRTLVWDVVDPADRERLQTLWGWVDKSRRTVDGHRVRRRLVTGEIDDILGLVLEQDGSVVAIQTGGKRIEIPRDQVVEILDEPMDPRDIWSPEQLYDRYVEQLEAEGGDTNAPSTREKWKLAEYTEWAGLLEKARAYYQACADDEEFLRNTIARQRLERVEALLRDQAALDQLRDIKMSITVKAFRKADEGIQEFEAQHAEASDAVKRRFERTKKEFDQRRNAYFQREAREWFMNYVQSLLKAKIKERVKGEDISFSDCFKYLRADLEKEAFEKLAERLNRKYDTDPAQAQDYWTNRPKRTWWSASYGSGTFIARPPKLKKTDRNRGGSSRNRGGKKGGNQGPMPKTPPKPTRDSWWAKSKPKDKVEWLLAKFVEDSALFEIAEREDATPCPTCNGRGYIEKTLQNGALWVYVCTRCAGAAHDIRIRFR